MRKQNFNRLLVIGLMFLILGNTLLLTLPRAAVLSESANDAIAGLFYGLAIGCMLMALRRKAGSALQLAIAACCMNCFYR